MSRAFCFRTSPIRKRPLLTVNVFAQVSLKSDHDNLTSPCLLARRLNSDRSRVEYVVNRRVLWTAPETAWFPMNIVPRMQTGWQTSVQTSDHDAEHVETLASWNPFGILLEYRILESSAARLHQDASVYRGALYDVSWVCDGGCSEDAVLGAVLCSKLHEIYMA